MRVANIIEDGRVAGPQIRMVLIAAALNGRADTIVFMPRKNSQEFQMLCVEAKVEYRLASLNHLSKSLPRIFRYFTLFMFEVLSLAASLRSAEIDVVHVSGGSWQCKGLLAAKLAGIPAVWHLNDTKMPSLVRWIFKRMAPLAAGFIFSSR